MALRVWLPLTDTLENKGVSNVTVTNNGATINTNGKIGSCYAFNGNNYYISLVGQQLFDCFKGEAQPFSICMWVYHADSRRAILFGDWSLSNSIGFNIELYTGHDVRFYWNGSPDYNTTLNVGASTWNHIAITYDGTKLRSYLNGSLTATRDGVLAARSKTAGEFRLGRDNRTTDTALNGYLNDVRIYDHCLSAAEVHEISQGLVLHYKLDGFQGGYGNPNLITGYDTSFLSYNDGAVTLFTNQMNGGAQEIVSNIPGTSKCLHLHSSGGNNRQYRTIAATSGKSYTISVDYYSTSNQNTALHCELNGGNYSWASSNGAAYTTPNQWVHLSATYTNLTSNATLYYFIYCTNGTDCYVKNFKIEEGTSATNWVPNGVTSTIIQDSSGYGHNGTINGTMSLSSNTARYNSSIVFNGSDNAIKIPFNDIIKGDDYTVSVWTYKETIGTKNYQTILGGPSGFELEARSSSSTSPLYRIHNWGGGTTAYEFNKWNLFTFVRTASDSKLYVNGELKITGTAGTIPSGNYFIGAWRSATEQNYEGLMSDFRLYATALSADDIKQLYQVGAKVDNLQNIHTFEFIEGNTPTKITKQGQLKTLVVQEAINQSLAYDKTLYTEPDGSTWIHIFHHNNPAGSRFTGSANDWSNGIYIDANKWYNVEPFLNDTLPYEFIVKQKTTSDATETKYRWIQTPNPLTATWTDVKPGTVTFITTSGYSSSSYGGMYLMKSSNLHMCIANGSNGNWFGGIGASGSYNGGIPGYPNTTVTSGYIDLYLRIYPTAKIIKNIGVGSNSLIEK